MSKCAVLLHTFYLLVCAAQGALPDWRLSLGLSALGNLSCPLVPTRRPHPGYLPCVHGASNPSSPLLPVFQVPSTEKMLNKYLPDRLMIKHLNEWADLVCCGSISDCNWGLEPLKGWSQAELFFSSDDRCQRGQKIKVCVCVCVEITCMYLSE